MEHAVINVVYVAHGLKYQDQDVNEDQDDQKAPHLSTTGIPPGRVFQKQIERLLQ
jgi:hypothetical protein